MNEGQDEVHGDDPDMEYTPVERWDVKMVTKDAGREIEELQARVKELTELVGIFAERIGMLEHTYANDRAYSNTRFKNLETIVHRLLNGAAPFWKDEVQP